MYVVWVFLQNGVVSLIDCTLMEDPEGTDDECECFIHVAAYINMHHMYHV